MTDLEILELVNGVKRFLEIENFEVDGGGREPILTIKRKRQPFETVAYFQDEQVIGLKFRNLKENQIYPNKQIRYESDELEPRIIGTRIAKWNTIVSEEKYSEH